MVRVCAPTLVISVSGCLALCQFDHALRACLHLRVTKINGFSYMCVFFRSLAKGPFIVLPEQVHEHNPISNQAPECSLPDNFHAIDQNFIFTIVCVVILILNFKQV